MSVPNKKKTNPVKKYVQTRYVVHRPKASKPVTTKPVDGTNVNKPVSITTVSLEIGVNYDSNLDVDVNVVEPKLSNDMNKNAEELIADYRVSYKDSVSSYIRKSEELFSNYENDYVIDYIDKERFYEIISIIHLGEDIRNTEFEREVRDKRFHYFMEVLNGFYYKGGFYFGNLENKMHVFPDPFKDGPRQLGSESLKKAGVPNPLTYKERSDICINRLTK